MSTIRMLGLDPSLTSTGWSVLEIDTETREIVNVIAMGTIKTAPTKNKKQRKSSDDLDRARTIIMNLRDVIKEYDIKLAASEVPAGAQSAKAARAFGIVVGLLASLPVPMFEVTPRQVKMATCDSAVADKEDIMRWALTVTLGTPVHGKWKVGAKNDFEIELRGKYMAKTMEHQADSIAVGHTAAKGDEFANLAGMLASVLA